MNKTLIAFATAVIAAMTMFTSAAEAGMKLRIGFGFPIGAFTAHGGGGYGHHRRYRRHKYVKRRVKHKKVYHAKKKAESNAEVAKTEEAPKATPVVEKVESENSSITTAALPAPEETPVEEIAPQETSEAVEAKPATEQEETAKLDCKKFFPAVGMTLSVPCE